jgi:hypothetical protein
MLPTAPAGLKPAAGVTKPSTQRVPGGLDVGNINLTTTLFQLLSGSFFAPAGRKTIRNKRASTMLPQTKEL